MALGDTVYVFDIELANSDSSVYESLRVSVARHPSETPENMLTRVLALLPRVHRKGSRFRTDCPSLTSRRSRCAT